MVNRMLVPAVARGITTATVKIKPFWSKFALPPVYSGDPSIVGNGRHLWALGGWPDEFPVADVWRWDMLTNTWSACAPLPSERWAGAGVYLNGRIYHLGGDDYNDSTDTVFSYDPSNDAAGWTTLHPLPFIAAQFSAAAANGKLYIPGAGATVWCYDPTNDAAGWSQIAARPVASGSGTLVGSGSRLFYLGGVDDATTWLTTAYSYNAGTDTWSSIAALPGGTFSTAAGFAADGRLWHLTRGQPYAWSYDPANNAAGWRAEADFPANSYAGWLNQVGPWMTYLNGQFGFAYRISSVPNDVLYPDDVIGSTAAGLTISVAAAPVLPAVKYLVPAVVRGQTSVKIRSATYLRPELVYSQNTTAIELSLRGVFEPDVVAGSTFVHVAGDIKLTPDPVRGSTDVDIPVYAHGDRWLVPFHEFGATLVRIISRPVLRTNTPILLALSARARIESVEPNRISGQKMRSVGGLVLTMPEPAVSDGRPSLPDYWAGHHADGSASGIAATAKLIQGPLHIHAIPDPNPVWDPRTSGWTVPPPPSGAGDCRWTVDSLPDPRNHSNGWYWLGEATSQDGTAGIEGGARQWAPADGSNGPTWHSFFPFKPSVNGYDAPIVGERQVHHAKGVHFNSHYIEHMWADFGANQGQPFTWIVVATVMSDSFPGYQHNILDAGRNPDEIGFPRVSAGSTSYERQLGDNLPYRTRLTWGGDTAQMSTSGDAPLRTRGAGGYHPRMFISIFDGDKSQLGVWDPFGKYMSTGTVAGGPVYSHRYMVIGREQGWLSQRHASNIMVFEIRYWRRALIARDLEMQYAQLSSTYQFDAYKQL